MHVCIYAHDWKSSGTGKVDRQSLLCMVVFPVEHRRTTLGCGGEKKQERWVGLLESWCGWTVGVKWFLEEWMFMVLWKRFNVLWSSLFLCKFSDLWWCLSRYGCVHIGLCMFHFNFLVFFRFHCYINFFVSEDKIFSPISNNIFFEKLSSSHIRSFDSKPLW